MVSVKTSHVMPKSRPRPRPWPVSMFVWLNKKNTFKLSRLGAFFRVLHCGDEAVNNDTMRMPWNVAIAKAAEILVGANQDDVKILFNESNATLQKAPGDKEKARWWYSHDRFIGLPSISVDEDLDNEYFIGSWDPNHRDNEQKALKTAMTNLLALAKAAYLAWRAEQSQADRPQFGPSDTDFDRQRLVNYQNASLLGKRATTVSEDDVAVAAASKNRRMMMKLMQDTQTILKSCREAMALSVSPITTTVEDTLTNRLLWDMSLNRCPESSTCVAGVAFVLKNRRNGDRIYATNAGGCLCKQKGLVLRYMTNDELAMYITMLNEYPDVVCDMRLIHFDPFHLEASLMQHLGLSGLKYANLIKLGLENNPGYWVEIYPALSSAIPMPPDRDLIEGLCTGVETGTGKDYFPEVRALLYAAERTTPYTIYGEIVHGFKETFRSSLSRIVEFYAAQGFIPTDWKVSDFGIKIVEDKDGKLEGRLVLLDIDPIHVMMVPAGLKGPAMHALVKNMIVTNNTLGVESWLSWERLLYKYLYQACFKLPGTLDDEDLEVGHVHLSRIQTCWFFCWSVFGLTSSRSPIRFLWAAGTARSWFDGTSLRDAASIPPRPAAERGRRVRIVRLVV